MAIPLYGQYLQGAISFATSANPILAFPQPTLPGSLLIAALTWSAATGTVTSVTDQLNSVCPQAFSSLMGGVAPGPTPWASAPIYQADSTSSQLFFVPNNVKGGPNVVTATLSGSQAWGMVVAEYYGGGIYLNSATNHGTTGGAGTGSQSVPVLSCPNLTPFLEWDRANTFQGALAQSQIQQPGILLISHFRATALIGTPLAGTSLRLALAATIAFGDSGTPLLNPVASPAPSVGWNLTGISTWDQVVAAFAVPNLSGRPS